MISKLRETDELGYPISNALIISKINEIIEEINNVEGLNKLETKDQITSEKMEDGWIKSHIPQETLDQY